VCRSALGVLRCRLVTVDRVRRCRPIFVGCLGFIRRFWRDNPVRVSLVAAAGVTIDCIRSGVLVHCRVSRRLPSIAIFLVRFRRLGVARFVGSRLGRGLDNRVGVRLVCGVVVRHRRLGRRDDIVPVVGLLRLRRLGVLPLTAFGVGTPTPGDGGVKLVPTDGTFD